MKTQFSLVIKFCFMYIRLISLLLYNKDFFVRFIFQKKNFTIISPLILEVHFHLFQRYT